MKKLILITMIVTSITLTGCSVKNVSVYCPTGGECLSEEQYNKKEVKEKNRLEKEKKELEMKNKECEKLRPKDKQEKDDMNRYKKYLNECF